MYLSVWLEPGKSDSVNQLIQLSVIQLSGGHCIFINKEKVCIPNFKPNIQVGFQVGTSFSRFLKFDFNVIFS